MRVVLHDKDAHTSYANFARATVNPEEVILDFGLNPNPYQAGTQDVNVTQRLILNFYTAKRLCMALAMTLKKHEEMFGEVKLDINQRLKNPPPPAAPPGGNA
jgi:hypothetical protein